jgi:nucleoid DNA-binding protein
MNETLTSQHLVQILVGKTGCDKAEIEVFLRELVTVVNEEILSGQDVQIKGIGSFKVKLTKERERRDADTQETVIIPPHHKLAFVPVESFRRHVNTQFESFPFESKAMEGELPAGLHVAREEDEEEIEDEEITNEQAQSPDRPLEDRRDEETQYAGSIEGEKPDEATQLAGCPLEDRRDEETQYAGSIEREKPDEATQLAGSSWQEPAWIAVDSSGQKARPTNPSFNPTQIALAIILLLILCGGIWYLFATRGSSLFHRNKSGWISGESFALPGDSAAREQARQKANVMPDTGMIAVATDSVPPAATDTVESVSSRPGPESAAKKTTADAGKKASSSRTGRAAWSTSSGKVLARITMPAGKRLTLLALKYYGNKIFWVYIYDFNKARIGPNPDIVPAGMELLIPAKEVYGIDANDVASCEKARLLQAEIKGRIE